MIRPLSTVVYALDKLGDIADRTAVVVGLGPTGLLATWLMNKCGPRRVVGVDPIAGRCHPAHRVGAEKTFAVNSGTLLHLIAQEDTWAPADICVEAVGHQTRIVNDCIHLVKHSGTVLIMGEPDQTDLPVCLWLFFRRNIHLIASATPSWETWLTRAAGLISQREDEPASPISHRFTLDSVSGACMLYETRIQGPFLKVLLPSATQCPTAT